GESALLAVCIDLVDRDVGFFGNVFDEGDFVVDSLLELFRVAVLNGLDTRCGEALGVSRSLYNLGDFAVKLFDNICSSIRRQEQTVPGIQGQIRNTQLRERRNARQQLGAVGRRHCKGTQLSGLDLRTYRTQGSK